MSTTTTTSELPAARVLGQVYAGGKWLGESLSRKGRTISPFGLRVADLLGDLFLGIYHVQRDVLRETVDWSQDWIVELTVYCPGWATFDGNTLTRLVVLCHDYCIRCDLTPVAPRRMRLMFHPRKNRDGDMSSRHPTIEQVVERWRQACPAEAAHA